MIHLNDTRPETMYKMYESTKHTNQRLFQFQKQEESFYQVIKKYTNLPDLIQGLNKIPEQLQQDQQFLELIEGQFELLYEQIQKSIQKGGGPQLPPDVTLVFPETIHKKVALIQQEVSRFLHLFLLFLDHYGQFCLQSLQKPVANHCSDHRLTRKIPFSSVLKDRRKNYTRFQGKAFRSQLVRQILQLNQREIRGISLSIYQQSERSTLVALCGSNIFGCWCVYSVDNRLV